MNQRHPMRPGLLYTALVAALLLPGLAMAQAQRPAFMNPLADLTVPEDRPRGLYGDFESRRFQLHGDMRMRGGLFSNFDMDRGPTPSGDYLWPTGPSAPASNTVTSANMRIRLEPELFIGQEVRLVARIDMLDNVILGSTPRGYPRSSAVPQISGSTGQEPPSAGVNSYSDSIRVKQAWGELMLPFGFLIAGRTGNNWGLGMVANSGDGVDDDWDDAVDRIGFVTSLFDHFVALSYDINASGPSTASSANPGGQPVDVTNRDDVGTLSVAVLRHFTPEILRTKLRAGQAVFNYGAYVSWRRQDEELPTYYLMGLAAQDRDFKESEFVKRDVDYVATDMWLRFNIQRLRIELEAVYLWGRAGDASMIPGVVMPELSFNQFGGVLQAEWQPSARLPLTAMAEVGLASGDSAWGFGAWPSLDQVKAEPGDLNGPQLALPDDRSVDNFRFHPNFHVDRILWRRIVGTFTDGVYAKGRLRWHPLPSLRLDADVVYSRALETKSAPGLAKPLGVETGLELTWFARSGFEATGCYAVLMPLAGLRNPYTGAEAAPAHFAEARLAFRF